MRKEFGSKVKLAAYNRCLDLSFKPRCEVMWDGKRCNKLILGIPEYDHIQADGLGGLPTLENCQVACGACHKKKTHTEDRPIMAAADKQYKSKAGIKRKYKWPTRKFGARAMLRTVARQERIQEEMDT